MQNNENRLDIEAANRFFQERNGGPTGLVTVAGFCPNPVHEMGAWYGLKGPSVVDISHIKEDHLRRRVLEAAVDQAVQQLNSLHDGMDGCHLGINIRAIGKIGNKEILLMG